MSGVRVVAVLELLKGALVFVVGFGLLSLINHDAEEYAIYLVHHLHLNPASKFPRIFVDFFGHLTNLQLLLFASLAFFDTAIRVVITYGLWRGRRWAEWLGVAAAGIYIPIEIYEMARHLTWLKSATFITNVLIVIYLGYVLYRTDHKREAVSSTNPEPVDVTSSST